MRQNNITKWKYDSSLNCLLFFAQRLDELLFTIQQTHIAILPYHYGV